MKTMLRTLTLALGLAAAIVPATAAFAQTVRFAITDVEGLEELKRQFEDFRSTLSDITGLDVEFFPVNNRTVAAEALRAGQLEFVLTGPSEYVIFQSRTPVVPVVSFTRGDYFSVIAVLQDSGIRTIADLKGQKVAFGNVGSTSSHIAPSLILSDNGLDPVADIEAVHAGANVGYESLKRGDVAALGTSHGSFLRLRDEDGQVDTSTFRVIARGPDLPNDIILAGGHVAEDVVKRFRSAFSDPANAERLKKSLLVTADGEERYALTAFQPVVNDADYEMMRHGFVVIGQPQFSTPADW